jgi:type VI secretion system protein ImpL
MTSVTAAKLAAQKITQQFGATADGTVRDAVTRLLDDPVGRVEPYLRDYGKGELNAKGASFCSRYRSVLAKYPFDPGAATEATPEEVAALFRPVTGGLWTLYDEAVQNVLVRQGREFVSKGGGSITVSPAFRAFFNKAAAISDALFPQGASQPQLTFALRPTMVNGVAEVDVTIDGATNQYGNVLRPHSFTWHAAPSSTASIGGRANAASPRIVVQSYSGTWAPFRLFDHATRSTMTGNVLRAEWPAVGGSDVLVGLEVDFGDSAPVLRKGYFSGFTCVGRIAQ